MIPPARRTAPHVQPRILVVEDDPTQRSLLVAALHRSGFDPVGVESAQDALDALARGGTDLILLDLHLPDRGGDDVLAIVRGSERTRLLPIIMVSGDATEAERSRALAAGVTDFLQKPFDYPGLVEPIGALVNLKLFTDQLEQAENVLITLAGMIDARDPCTAGHSQRVARFASALGSRIGLTGRECETLRRGGLFHDIGKIAVRDAVLLKNGRLTDDERAEMQRHPVEGRRVIGSLQSLADTIPIVYHHHEKLDGSGYPDGLDGEAIPRLARIAAIADVFDALTTVRPYRGACDRREALELMRREAARGWWDRDLLEEFRGLLLSGEPLDAAHPSVLLPANWAARCVLSDLPGYGAGLEAERAESVACG